MLLRVYLALLGAAQKAYVEAGGDKNPDNPADAYMTLLGYFNSLRELGGSRRIIEDEVGSRLSDYGARKRVGEKEGLFADRTISYDVIELTSRIRTDQVADAKRLLTLPFPDKNHVDVAIAMNMISVGLDITRLVLMVVLGQPKTSAEYIQATSRVGHGPAVAAIRNARLQVALNARRIAAYRLIGYEGRGGRSVDAGETFGPGRTATALYEVVPTTRADDVEWRTVQVRGRNSSDEAWVVMDQTLDQTPHRFTEAPADFRFAAAAAELGLLLRESEYKGQASYAGVRSAARDALGADTDGRRAEFLALVDAANRIASEHKLTRRDAKSI